jgi:predicted nucleic acid-binding protein
VIYLDTTVALAALLSEDRRPPSGFWRADFIASRLLEYELSTRLHARRASDDVWKEATELLGSVSLVELSPPVLERASEAFPIPVRTLDALHLATAWWLRRELRGGVQLATYDTRMAAAAASMGMVLADA